MDIKIINDLISYDKNTGIFTWKTNRSGVTRGKIAGSITWSGYVSISILGERIRAHRLAWLIEYGELPKGQIDHVNGIRDDNRISNLRCISHRDNHLNMVSHRNGRLYGTIWDNGRYLSRIRVDGKRIFLGTFEKEEDAHQAYLEAYKKYVKKEPFKRLS